MCSAPNVYMFVYILIGTHMVPLRYFVHNVTSLIDMYHFDACYTLSYTVAY